MTAPAPKTLSDRFVETLTVRHDTIVWDRRLPGFGVRAYPTGGKTYFAQAQGPNGRQRIRIARHGTLNARQARTQAGRIIAGIHAGETFPTARRGSKSDTPTLAEVAARYLDDYVAVRLKPETVNRIRSTLNRHILPAIGRYRIDAVQRRHVAALHRRLSGKPAKANQVLGTLSFMYELAETWGYVPDGYNPCRGVKRYPSRRRERFLTDRELDRLGRVLADSQTGSKTARSAIAALRLLLLTGCCKNEIVRLRWAHVGLDRAELRLPDTKTGARTIALPAAAVNVLADLTRVPGNPWVFPGHAPGTRICGIDSVWFRVRKRAGLHDVRIHDLRHSYASRALALGEPLPMIGKLLGHRRIETTARYAHLTEDAVLESAERIAATLADDLLVTLPGRVE